MHNEDFYNSVITTIVILLYNLQPTLLKYGFLMFQCTNLYRNDTSISFMTSDYDIMCWDKNYLVWALSLGLTNIFIWGIGIPLVLFSILYRNRKNLDDDNIKMKYGFIYKGYSISRFYWEFIIMFRKLLIVIINVFIGNNDVLLEVFVGFWVILFSISIQLKGTPFDSSILNSLELKSLISIGVLSFSSLYFMMFQGKYFYLDLIMIIFCGFGNIYFLSNWIWEFYKTISQQIKENKEVWIEKYNILIIRISKKIKCCKIFYHKNLNYSRFLSVIKDSFHQKYISDIKISYISPEGSKSDIVLEEGPFTNSIELSVLNNENSKLQEEK